MSKKKKKKFKKQLHNYQEQKQQSSVDPGVAMTASVSAKADSKNAVSHQDAKNETIYSAHAKEYRFIWGDLIRVVAVNGLFLLAIVVIYYLNRNSQFLETWYSQLFK